MDETPVQMVEVTLGFDTFAESEFISLLGELDEGLGPDIKKAQRVDVHMDGQVVVTLQVRCPHANPLAAVAFLAAQLASAFKAIDRRPALVTFGTYPEALEATA